MFVGSFSNVSSNFVTPSLFIGATNFPYMYVHVVLKSIHIPSSRSPCHTILCSVLMDRRIGTNPFVSLSKAAVALIPEDIQM